MQLLAYLDGASRDREAHSASKRSGRAAVPDQPQSRGLGLNLTAAEYVFLLDPWWNPAVEAQAIDRAHRIGQTRHVLAYRLVARDTIEEKILQLQQTKRDRADAIISEENSILRQLTPEDLDLLLS
ncbi:MAG: helicase-related protein [Thermoanaerobaculia bacterium]